MMKRPGQRVAVFIDTQNMYHSAKHVYGARVNFAAVVEAAVGPRRMVRASAYVAKSKTGEEGAFFEALIQTFLVGSARRIDLFLSFFHPIPETAPLHRVSHTLRLFSEWLPAYTNRL